MTLRKLNRACLVVCITSIAIITLLSLSLIWESDKEHGEIFYKILSTAWLILFSAGVMLSISKVYTGRTTKTSPDEPLFGDISLDASPSEMLPPSEPSLDEIPLVEPTPEPTPEPPSDLPVPPPPDSE